VADGIAFPKDMAVTPDNSTLSIAELRREADGVDIADDGGLSHRRVWADGVGPEGTCADAKGAIWTGVGGFGDSPVGRVREGGEVLEQVHVCRSGRRSYRDVRIIA
jgi:sugar lactone lactonase YvrE